MIRPNPFRDLDHYPLDSRKLEVLRESIEATGFWQNFYGRRASDGNGGMFYEIAYGHHRLAILQERAAASGTDPEIDLPLSSLTDEQMLQIMSRENMSEWGTSATVEIETVRAVVKAYSEGKITLEAPDPRSKLTSMRDAPSFRQLGDDRSAQPRHPYTSHTVAPFLGWRVQKVQDVLGHLELIENGILGDDAFRGLTTTQALVMSTRAREEQAAAAERAAAAETDQAAQEAAAEEARQREEAARQEKERAEQERQAAIASRDEQLRSNAELAEKTAREAWLAAKATREGHEKAAQERAAEAAKAREEAAERARKAAEDAGGKMRAGTPTREVAKERTPRHAQAADEHPMEAQAVQAAGILQRMLKESDFAEFFTQVAANRSIISDAARGQLVGALTALIDDAMNWRSQLADIPAPVPVG